MYLFQNNIYHRVTIMYKLAFQKYDYVMLQDYNVKNSPVFQKDWYVANYDYVRLLFLQGVYKLHSQPGLEICEKIARTQLA